MTRGFLLLPLFLFFGLLGAQAQPDLTIPQDCLQLVVVHSQKWDDPTATMVRFERVNPESGWEQKGAEVAVNLGRTGLAWGESPLMKKSAFGKNALQKREGDGRSPAGLFPILRAFGHPSRPAGYSDANLPFLEVEAQQCVDDKRSPYYNQIVEPSEVGGVTWASAEQMKIDLYELGLVVGHNCPKAQPGFGSCIFFHLERGPGKPTAGCTSMDRASLTSLVLWLHRSKNPAVLQLPTAEYERLGPGFPSL